MTKESIETAIFHDALGEKYLSYALSTIMSRSLPDVRDGLKPVHRRLLYAMMQLKLDPKANFKKCARVVGDVIGKYHPHGDQAVYDTMVRLAQEFSVRYPLVLGQGNFGSIDGDNAAAMRYTEAKLTDAAIALLNDIDKDTVDFRPTYDQQDEEPCLLPASFPNILANGSEGIAVGMATSIPPHNLEELCQALLLLLKKDDTTIESLMQVIGGPDLPTGGVIIDSPEVIVHNYKIGRGSFRVRARWNQENFSHGTYQIVITEIPYQVQKSKLIERLANLLKDKKLPLLGNIRDESSEDIRIILEPKNRGCDPNLLMESVFKTTDLEYRINLNMNVLTAEGLPRVLNIKEVLQEFLSFRDNVITRRSHFELNKINHRIEILEGLIIAYLNLDEIINIIRNNDEPKPILIQKFVLSEIQAESILNMKLRSLRKLEEFEIRGERNELLQRKDFLEAVIGNKAERDKLIADEIKSIQKIFGKKTNIGARRTSFEVKENMDQFIQTEILIEKEPVTIICSKLGWLRSLRGHSDNVTEDIKYKDGDKEQFALKAFTTDRILFFTERGKFYTMIADSLSKSKGSWEPLKTMMDMEDNDKVVDIMIFDPEKKMIIASRSGKGFVIAHKDVLAHTKTGKKILNLQDKDKALGCFAIEGDHVAVVGNNRKMLIFRLDEIPEMKKGQGVTLQKYKEAVLTDVKTFNLESGLTWNSGSRTKVEKDIVTWLGKRALIGKSVPFGFAKDNKFTSNQD